MLNFIIALLFVIVVLSAYVYFYPEDKPEDDWFDGLKKAEQYHLQGVPLQTLILFSCPCPCCETFMRGVRDYFHYYEENLLAIHGLQQAGRLVLPRLIETDLGCCKYSTPFKNEKPLLVDMNGPILNSGEVDAYA